MTVTKISGDKSDVDRSRNSRSIFFISSRSSESRMSLPHIPVFYNTPPIYAGRFSLFLYYVRSVSPLSCFLRLQISSGSFGFMKLLLRGNVVSYNGTLIILNRSTSTFRLNERSRTRVYSPEKQRKGKNERVERNKKEKCAKKKHCFR